jgi:hypothetical protein
MHIHFVGFRGEEYWAAVKVFGKPDFIHRWHDARMYGDIGDHDILVFGPGADPARINKYSWQDHEIW